MVKRSAAAILRLVAWLVASIAIVVAIVLWRLASEPLSLDPLTPYLEAALSPADAPVTVRVGETAVQLREGGLELVVLDVRGLDADGEPVFTLPEVAVDLSVRALLLRGLIAPERLAARAPSLVLVRDASGRIGLGDAAGTTPTDGAALELGAAVAAQLLEPPDPARPLSYLREFRLAGGEVVLEDRITGGRLRATNAELGLVRRPDGVGASLEFFLANRGDVARISATARHAVGGERISFEARVRGLRPSHVTDLLPDLPFAPAGLDLAVGGQVSGEVALDGDLSPLAFDLWTRNAVVDLPEHLARPLAVDRLAVEGTLAPDLADLTIDSFAFEGHGASANGEGRLSRQDGALAVSADLRASTVRADDLELFWPPGMAEAARGWVTANISDGVATSGEVRIDLRPGDLQQKPLRADAIDGRFAFEDLTIRYFDALPPIAGVDGSATFDARSMTFEATDGAYRGLRVRGGTVAVTGIGIEGRHETQLEVVADIEGPVADALALLDMEPFGFASELGIDPARVTGTSRTELRVGLPLYREVDANEVRIAAESTLGDVSAEQLMGEVDLRDGDFELSVDREAMALRGEATVREVRLDVDWQEYFADDREVDRRFRLQGLLNEEQFASVGLDALPVPLGGGLRFDVAGTQTGTRREFDVALDLGPLEVAVPALDWEKRPGEPAELFLTLGLGDDAGVIAVDSFSFNGAALGAAGSLVLDRDTLALRELVLERFNFRRQRGAATVSRADDGALAVEVRATSLNLDSLLEQADIAGDGGEPTPLRLSVSADLLYYGDAQLAGVEGTLERTREGWRSGRLQGRLPNGETVELTLEPEGEAEVLRVTSADAGELLRLLEQTQRIRGGRFRFNANITEQIPDIEAEGTLRINDFTLQDAPVLARLLTLASLTGIGNLLGGEGIAMDRLKLPFTLADGVLTLDGGRLSGSQLGLTVDGDVHLDAERLDLRGTIVPVYTLNRVIGQIPVIGDFLAGQEGEGAFAFTFSVRGSFDEPEVTVNPLSVLAPGFIRDLFGVITRGEGTPPDMLESDGN